MRSLITWKQMRRRKSMLPGLEASDFGRSNFYHHELLAYDLLRQATSKLPTSGSGMAQITPHLAENHPRPYPLIDYWMGITWFLPSSRFSWILKVLEKEKHALSASRFHPGLTKLPFVFPFSNFFFFPSSAMYLFM
jgi:hypothetical protein